MHIHNLDQWRHAHDFEIHDRGDEHKVLWVVGLTVVMMTAEIVAGMLFGSMALLADGWHMGTHAVALGIAAMAYYFARKHAQDRRFTFGTGKVGVLGGFSSAVVLAVVALLMAVESVQRLLQPQPIRFNEALWVAVLGLTVNLVSALLLQQSHPHEDENHNHDHPNDHDHTHHHHHDHNMRSAYLHVVADALTSVLAIAALTVGKFWHWIWLDAVMGIVGALIISQWAWGLLRDTGKILLDRAIDPQTVEAILHLIEADADNRITDLHMWKIGANQMAAIVCLVTHFPKPAQHYKELLAPVRNLAHVTVEVIHCDSEPCIVPPKAR
ncbi:MAG: CDF family Co(II)/Ni(II) efflux transporter DmeF [Desulfobacteraceae bacterium]|nr:CDF family Co(II)/Ni(II) efflux transporter DmeF [Desulfobacteraceae bacterium]